MASMSMDGTYATAQPFAGDEQQLAPKWIARTMLAIGCAVLVMLTLYGLRFVQCNTFANWFSALFLSYVVVAWYANKKYPQ